VILRSSVACNSCELTVCCPMLCCVLQVCCWDLALERDPEEEAALAPEGNAMLQVRLATHSVSSRKCLLLLGGVDV
jgi:hypothetical protein